MIAARISPNEESPDPSVGSGLLSFWCGCAHPPGDYLRERTFLALGEATEHLRNIGREAELHALRGPVALPLGGSATAAHGSGLIAFGLASSKKKATP